MSRSRGCIEADTDSEKPIAECGDDQIRQLVHKWRRRYPESWNRSTGMDTDTSIDLLIAAKSAATWGPLQLYIIVRIYIPEFVINLW
jgi:hypothetical protein